MAIGSARLRLALAAGLALAPFAARAEIAVSANDNKAVLENGVTKVVANPQPDTVSIINLSTMQPTLVTEIQAPASVVGPPGSVAVAADESFALVTSAMKVDPSDPTKMAPDDRLSVIDLKSSPPKVVDTVTVGKGAAGVSINKAGTLALVANRSEGTVSVLTISGGKVAEKEKIKLGAADSGPSQPVFTPDGTMALVTRDNDHKISVLSVSGDKVEYTKRDINAGLRPYQVDVTGSGEVAVVANIGIGQGDADTISLIDLKAKPPRVVRTVTVGQTPEGLKMSPDGQFVAVTVMNGSNKPKDSPFFNDNGLVKLFRVTEDDLGFVAEAPVGHWCQGAAWSKDSRKLLVQCMVEKEIYAFKFDGAEGFDKTGTIKVNGGPAGIRTAE
ncbi:MAG TPA: YncE family protein [Beijerinckiaceae bacterium]|jgi:DNA-binding beta-propeller fold protein YncE